MNAGRYGEAIERTEEAVEIEYVRFALERDLRDAGKCSAAHVDDCVREIAITVEFAEEVAAGCEEPVVYFAFETQRVLALEIVIGFGDIFETAATGIGVRVMGVGE